MGNFFQFLILQKPDGTAITPDAGTLRYLIPWAIFCALAILVPIYYFNEGRKRFFGSHALHKWALDRLMSQIWPLGLVGLIMIAAVAGDVGLFAWPLWHALWALWALGLVGYWGYYFILKYRGHLAAYHYERTKQRYMPPQKPKKATGAR